MRKNTLLLLYFVFCSIACFANDTAWHSIGLRDWQFSRDSINWSSVTVPHDWAIAGPFDKKWDLQMVAIAQNGETEATEKSGRSGSLPWIGRGFYHTTVTLSKADAESCVAELQFDGAMADAHVWVNGVFAGNWPYGYNAFRLNIAGLLHEGENTIAVSLDNREESSRWYPGGGIYRPVKLVLAHDGMMLNDWGTYFNTLKADENKAEVLLSAQIRNNFKGARVRFEVIDAEGTCVLENTAWTEADGTAGKVVEIEKPHLWSPETPYLYNVCASILGSDETVLATEVFKLGVRTIEYSKNGFFLNGKKRQFKGVCLHHDLGPLGAAINKSALIRQIRILKDMGCDAIRTSHNMPSTMQMELCDSMGMMVMAESFDMWRFAKCKNGYARFFDEWAERDITNLVLNHRNHPSIVMWSIGNEIPEQWSQEGRRLSQMLQAVCHRYDASRPVTQGMDNAEPALASGFAQVMDVAGFNYRVHKYDKNMQSLPQGYLLGSETCSTVSSRGVYKFPVILTHSKNYADGQCSSYDTEFCGWSNIPDDDFLMQEDKDYSIGQFVWTGFDYLGEPTPYDGYWPSRSSYFGICDLAGLPKDRYYLYRSQWNENSHTVHLLPHWSWKGREGEITPVYCYTDGYKAELFVNGKSQGMRTKQLAEKEIVSSGRWEWNKQPSDAEAQELAKQTSVIDRYRLRWNDVRYEPGEIKVVVYDKNDNIIGTETVRTAGKMKQLKLESDAECLRAGSDELAYITVSAIDSKGNLVPNCQDNIEVEVSGEGSFRGICNGDATSLEVFTQPKMKLFNGMLVVTVAAGKKPGVCKVVVKDRVKNIKNEINISIK